MFKSTRIHSKCVFLVATALILNDGYAGAHPLNATAPTDLTTRPAALASGIGRETIALPASGASRRARELYAQGLAQLHGYRWIEAARAFHTALRIDPDFALAELGLVRSYEAMKDPEQADQHLRAAANLRAKASPRDAGLITAISLRRDAATTEPDGPRAHAAYRASLDELLRTQPDDVEILLLRGNASEAVAWGKGMAGRETSLPFYEKAVRIAPDHPGARHYLAHSYENLGRYFDAANEAARFARLAPRTPHARHMYAHTLPRLGKWDLAIAEFEAAAKLEQEYFREEGIPADAEWHRVHNLTLLGLVYLRVGRGEDAERALRRAFATSVPDPQTVTWHTAWPEFLLAHGRNQEAAAAAATLAASENPIAAIVGTALRGEAELGAGDTAAAEASLLEARRLRVAYAPVAAAHPMGRPMGWLAEDAIALLAERLAFAAAGKDAAGKAFEARAAALAALPTFDGWGSGWLRIVRLERDARNGGEVALADRLATLAGGVPAPPANNATR
jgi:tetratricopeptide (TPR) repeat protein